MVQEDGSLVWEKTGEPVEGPVGLGAGARVILVTPNGHHEIVGVQLNMPDLLKRFTPTQQRWRAVMFKKRQAIENKLEANYKSLALADAQERDAPAALRRIERFEAEAREYNALAEEMGLPLVRVEIRG